MLYSYRAVNRSGENVVGSREAASERELADALKREGLLLLEAGVAGRAAAKNKILPKLTSLFQRVTLVERMVFARNLAVMVGAGLVLNKALDALEEQADNPKFKKLIAAVESDVLKGKTFAESLRSFKEVFGALFINMVEAGEISGNLERVLKILARQMKRDHDLLTKVRGALIYPAIVVLALVAIGILMMVYVVPTLTQTFKELNVPLPITTRLIIGGSNFIFQHYLYLLAALGLLAFGLIRALKSETGRQLFDRFILRTPVLGALVQKLNSARFARTLSSLISAGVPIVRSLEVTSGVLGNAGFRQALEESAVSIQHGAPLSATLTKHSDLFPPMVAEMLKVGEETGTIARMLLRLALFYEEEVSNTTKNLSSIIEPLLMLVIGGIVGLFALATIQPIYSSLGNL